MTRKPFPIKKIIGIILIVVMIGSVVLIVLGVQNEGYTKVTINNYSAANINLGGKAYLFKYYPPQLAIIPVGVVIDQVVQGTTYRYSDLEVKVSEVHSDYIVLLVKPL